jgi:hypothetical protein
VASFGVVGPYFFEDQKSAAATVTSAHYIHMLQTFVVPWINCLRHNCGELRRKYNGATAHTARLFMEVSAKCFLTVSFPIMVTNHGQEIPAHLSACDFFLWDYLKTLAHVTSFCGIISKVK